MKINIYIINHQLHFTISFFKQAPLMNNFSPKITSSNQQFLNLMKSIDRNYGKLQLLQGLFSSKDIVYVDPNKIYCIIQTSKYNKLRDEVSISKDNIEILSKKVYEYQMQVTSLSKEKEMFQKQYERLRLNQTLLKDNIMDMSQKLQQTNRQYINLQEKFIHLINQNNERILDKRINASLSSNVEKHVEQISIQTSMTPQILQQIAQKPIIREIEPQVDIISQIQTNLYEMFEQKIRFFQEQLNKKLEILQNQQHSIEKWQHQNSILQKQNQQLKQQIIDRNIEEQKLTIWRQNVFAFINRIQNNISASNEKERVEDVSFNEVTSVEVQDLKNEIIHLKGKMAEMRQQAKWVQDFMICQQEINEDGAVGLLVRLSQKLKVIIKNMLLEVELP